MASIRRGYSDDFTLKNNSVGIGTSTGQEALDVVDGAVKGQDLKVTGISSFTAYEGFLRADQQIAENTTLSFDQGPSASLSGEIIVGTGVTVTIASVGLGTTMVGVGTHTIENTIDTTDATRAGGSEFFDGYGWRQVDNTTRSGRAVFGGGYIDGNTRTIDMQLINIPTLGNSTYFGDLARDLSTDGRGVGSAVRGILGSGYGIQTPGGGTGRVDDMDYFTIASEGNAIDFGNLTIARNGLGSASSSTRGIFCGGATNYPSVSTHTTNSIEYVQISTTGNALDFGDLIKERGGGAGIVGSATRGIIGAGDDYHTPAWQYTALGQLDAINIASKGNSVDFGTDAVSRIQGGACGNAVRGCFAGGYVSDQYAPAAPANREAARAMTVISISTFGNSVEFGTLSSGARIYLGAASSNTRGIWTGGSQYPVHFNEIEYTQFASLGDTIDFGDLYRNKGYMQAATSDSHGGLGGF